MTSGLTPQEIYTDFKAKNLDSSKASELLTLLIENPVELNNPNRILSVKFLGLIGSKEDKVFNFLENLLMSDLHELVRGNAARVLIRNFPEKAATPIKWSLKNEKSEECITLIIKSLEKSNNKELKSLLDLIEYVDFKGNIFFPFGVNPIINLSSKSIDNILEIKGLENLVDLNKLYLSFNKITEITGLKNLIKLKTLHLQGNKIRKIKGLDNLKNLEYLYLNNNEISKIQGIENLSSLKSLMIYDNQISEIQNLDKLSNLEILNIRNNSIVEIKGLGNLHNLKRLDISNNRITEIKGLDTLSKLEFLDLSHNQISEIEGLDKLKNLKFLDLRNNKISRIKQLKILEQLDHLYLGFNRILKIENPEMMNDKFELDTSNIEEMSRPDSPFDFFYTYKSRKDLSKRKIAEIRDIKYMSPFLKSQSLINDLNLKSSPLDYFKSSTWMMIWTNNELEIFQLSKSGEITWIQKGRKRNFER